MCMLALELGLWIAVALLLAALNVYIPTPRTLCIGSTTLVAILGAFFGAGVARVLALPPIAIGDVSVSQLVFAGAGAEIAILLLLGFGRRSVDQPPLAGPKAS
jgi:hypothetical protein